MPDRLDAEQRLFFEVLNDVWEKNRKHWERNARRIIWTVGLAAAAACGTTVGIIIAAQNRIAKTTDVLNTLQGEVATNREILLQVQEERRLQRERYEALMAAFAVTRQKMEETKRQ